MTPATQEQADAYSQSETLKDILAEPIGHLMFARHLVNIGSLHILLFIQEVEGISQCPNGHFRRSLSYKIFKKYIDPSSKAFVGVPFPIAAAVSARIQEDGEHANVFVEAKHFVRSTLAIPLFLSFLQGPYYKRLLSFRIHEQKTYKFTDFDFIRILGEGGFGKVFAVSKRDTRAIYACKTMNKAQVFAKQREEMLLNERNIFAEVHSPFIVNLYYAFQDDSALFLVMDLASGGELQYHLNKYKRFSEHWVKFYGSSILLALQYLHSKRIVYRDLKPENALLDENGHLRLIDLGLCSVIRPGAKLHRHCGTRSYMAPEQTYGDAGYGQDVDWWAFGVTLYVMLTGFNPFSRRRNQHFASISRKHSKTPSLPTKQTFGSPAYVGQNSKVRSKKQFELFIPELDKKTSRKNQRHMKYQRAFEITLAEMEWPPFISATAKDLIQSLLVIDPLRRMGKWGASEVKEHPFFHDIDWKKLYHKHISPPFVPSQSHVNAAYIEPAFEGLADSRSTKQQKSFEIPLGKRDFFAKFDYVSPGVYQKELMEARIEKNVITDHCFAVKKKR